MPAGQWAISGVLMPPSWTQCLYSRKGVLLTLAQASAVGDVGVGRAGHDAAPWRTGQPSRVCLRHAAELEIVRAPAAAGSAAPRARSALRAAARSSSAQPPLSCR